MPDRDDIPDPMDEAYRRAEQALDDEAARAGRRARLLAAVAGEPAAPAVSPPSTRRGVRRYGGWLAAAGVAGLAVVTAEQVYRLAPRQQQIAQTTAAPPGPAAANSPAPPPALTPSESPAPPQHPRRLSRAAPSAAPPLDVTPPPPLPIPPEEKPIPAPAQRFAEPSAAAGPQAQQDAGVSGRRTAPAFAAAPSVLAAPTTADAAEKLREAAAAGRIEEIEALLAQGVPVDAQNANGETALMKSIEAGQRDAVALLRRHGASLDLKNGAGLSARDMAAANNDPALDQALGLAR
jgi:hypothetical protein